MMFFYPSALRMTLRTKFLLFVTIIHAVLIALAAQLRTTNPALFVASEALLLASIILTVQLYRGFVRPFQLIAAGTAAIQAKDFSMTSSSPSTTA
jgi:two-component system nitrogen regulation sensor histidine kinase NtrY